MDFEVSYNSLKFHILFESFRMSLFWMFSIHYFIAWFAIPRLEVNWLQLIKFVDTTLSSLLILLLTIIVMNQVDHLLLDLQIPLVHCTS